ncbi:MAG: DUF456 domain-containing protein [Bacteroidales bacterium]
MDIVLIIAGALLLLIGLAGCLIPVIPGPPVSYAGLLLLHFTEQYSFEPKTLIIWLSITLLVTLLDYVVPIYGTKKLGGSRKGVWGSTIGLIFGLIIAPTGIGAIAIIIGPFAGAYIGEMMEYNDSRRALRSAFGSFIGFLTGTLMKLIVSGIILILFIKKLV